MIYQFENSKIEQCKYCPLHDTDYEEEAIICIKMLKKCPEEGKPDWCPLVEIS
jgi:hypothetical protein